MGNWEQAREDLIRFLRTISRAGRTIDGIDDDKNLIDAGIIDSLAIVQIILHLEQDHTVNLRDAGIDPNELTSVAGILRTIESAGK